MNSNANGYKNQAVGATSLNAPTVRFFPPNFSLYIWNYLLVFDTILLHTKELNMKYYNQESDECNWVQAREDEEVDEAIDSSGSEDEGDDCDSRGDSFTVSVDIIFILVMIHVLVLYVVDMILGMEYNN